jgi:hypothetical protein
MSTSSLLARSLLKPRIVIDQAWALRRATSTPGASRNASAIVVTPERPISSRVITNTAAGASASRSSTRDTVVILSANRANAPASMGEALAILPVLEVT